MPNLREQLQQCFQGRVCLMGLGNVDYGDDGFGVRLVEALAKSEGRSAKREGPGGQASADTNLSDCSTQYVIAGTAPERFIGGLGGMGCDHLIFVDAVDFGGVPGSAILLNSEQMSARYPQISTHKISLGLLAKWAEANGTTKAWLLGVQPESLRPGGELTPAVRATLELLLELVREVSLEVMA
jgi:hydrogenase 3 maturation protease